MVPLTELILGDLRAYRPYSEQRHDRNESEAVRDRLTVQGICRNLEVNFNTFSRLFQDHLNIF